MKNLILGMAAIVGVVAVVLLIITLVITAVYGIGWSFGWLAHLIIGPDIVFGITFEQLFGLMSVFSTMIGSMVSAMNDDNDVVKKIESVVTEKLKEYRGY